MTNVVCDDQASKSTRRLLATVGLIVATRDAISVDDLANRLCDLPQISIVKMPGEYQRKQHGPEQKGRGGKIRRW